MSLRITGDMDPEKALWIDTGIPPRYRHLSVDALFKASEDERRTPVARAGLWLDELDAQQRVDALGLPAHPATFGQGLLLVGPPGTGKTTLACAVACDVRRRKRGVFFTPWPAYVDAARSLISNTTSWVSYDEEAAYRAGRLLERALSRFLVVLDDVGHEHTTGTRFAEDRLADLLRERHRNGRPTAVTSNLSGEDWKNKYSEALRSFMDEATVMVPVTGASRRRRDAQG